MTEQEWLKETDPKPMVEFVRDRASDRKLRLFATACCRSVWHLLPDSRSRTAAEVAEQFADGLTAMGMLALAFRGADEAFEVMNSNAARVYDTDEKFRWQYDLALAITDVASLELKPGVIARNVVVLLNHLDRDYRSDQANLVRDIFGNPYRPATFAPAWCTPTATNLARAIYDDRQLPSCLFDNQRLAILADALEEAGCDNADILGHLRGGGDHVRGCWAVDLVLGKE